MTVRSCRAQASGPRTNHHDDKTRGSRVCPASPATRKAPSSSSRLRKTGRITDPTDYNDQARWIRSQLLIYELVMEMYGLAYCDVQDLVTTADRRLIEVHRQVHAHGCQSFRLE